MPRPFKRRCIRINPEFRSFRPRGFSSRKSDTQVLHDEELEALRLKDYAGFDQEKAADNMNVSVSTFQRILYSARKKVAGALLHGKAISIKSREEVINMPGRDGTGPMGQGSQTGAGRGLGRNGGRGRNCLRTPAGIGSPVAECVCPACNHKVPHKAGTPCRATTCPKCGESMVRGQ